MTQHKRREERLRLDVKESMVQDDGVTHVFCIVLGVWECFGVFGQSRHLEIRRHGVAH